MGRFDGKVAVVTASTDGIGLAVAERLATDGAKVMISSRKQTNVDSAVAQLRGRGLTVSGIACHVGKKEQRLAMLEKTVEEFGGIDILVSNAAVNPIFGQILDTTERAWDTIFGVNVKAAFFLIKETVPYIEKRGGGSIVMVSSIGGFVPSEFLGAYSVSKTALLGLTKALVPQLTPLNIRINCIAPGVIKTRFSEAAGDMASHTSSAENIAQMKSRVIFLAEKLWKSEASEIAKSTIPMNRFAEPQECAGIVSFLVSEDASYITGENIVVSGGVTSRI